MRQMARRFAAREQFNKQSLECRLIAQPIDRYESAAEKIVDGAIFALANGTNPEVGIVLEAVAGRWQYGVIRLSSAQTVVSLDGQQIIPSSSLIAAAAATALQQRLVQDQDRPMSRSGNAAILRFPGRVVDRLEIDSRDAEDANDDENAHRGRDGQAGAARARFESG
jgi:hypothetical protein